ncbi:MAG TPA: MFS transporter, partial [Sphingomonas sp.]
MPQSVGRLERLSFATGDVGFNFVWQSIELYLFYFYVRVLDLHPGVAATIFLAGAVVDWVTDPMIGFVADRLSPRLSLRSWVAIGGPLSGVALALAFSQLRGDGAGFMASVIGLHVLLRFLYSVGNIPYAALTARISDDPDEHLRLTGLRLQGAALGGLIATGIYALLPAQDGAGSDFRLGAWILAAASVPAFLTTALGVRERVALRRVEKSKVARTGLIFVRSRPLRRLLATILAAGLAITVLNKSILFLFDAVGAANWGFVAALLPSLSLLVTVPIWRRLASRSGARAA